MPARRRPRPFPRLLRRFRRSRLAVAALALLAAATTRSVVARADVERARWGTSVEVVVVRRHVAAGSTLHALDLERRRVPMALVPAGASDTPDELVGRRVAADLETGDQLIAARLAGHRSILAGQLRDGEQAVTVPFGVLRPPVQRGDEVTVVAPATVAAGATAAVPGRVLALSSESITVAVATGSAPGLAAAALRGAVAVIVR